MAGEEGLEPSHAGIKIRCLNQLGDSPSVLNLSNAQRMDRQRPGREDVAINPTGQPANHFKRLTRSFQRKKDTRAGARHPRKIGLDARICRGLGQRC